MERRVADQRPAGTVRHADVEPLRPAAGETAVGGRSAHPLGEAAVSRQALGVVCPDAPRRSRRNVSRLTEMATHVSPPSLGKT